MALIQWMPVHELENILDEMRVPNGGDLATDVCQTDNEVVVEMQIPGIDPDKVDIEIWPREVHVSGMREQRQEVKDKDAFRSEIKRGSFVRVVPLPAEVDTNSANAQYDNGMLWISLLKLKTTEPKKIR